ncbi:MAG: hypothetical protein KKC25_08640 [Proteobacteria bacterium]|nr:hypothetical protein [Pseudomonadota bacterium]
MYVKADILVKKGNYKILAFSVASAMRIDGKSRNEAEAGDRGSGGMGMGEARLQEVIPINPDISY